MWVDSLQGDLGNCSAVGKPGMSAVVISQRGALACNGQYFEEKSTATLFCEDPSCHSVLGVFRACLKLSAHFKESLDTS